MSRVFFPMSLPPPSGPPAGYGAPPPGYSPPPGYGAPPKKTSTVTVVLIVLAAVFGGGFVVVAILAAILFPVFAKVRENARLASCESNVKQIELGLLQYTQDSGKYPPSAAAYKDALFPYIKAEGVFHCPDDQGGGVDYSMNTKLQGVSLGKTRAPGEGRRRVRRPGSDPCLPPPAHRRQRRRCRLRRRPCPCRDAGPGAGPAMEALRRRKQKRPGGYSAGPFCRPPCDYVLSPIVESCEVVVLPLAAALSSWNR